MARRKLQTRREQASRTSAVDPARLPARSAELSRQAAFIIGLIVAGILTSNTLGNMEPLPPPVHDGDKGMRAHIFIRRRGGNSGAMPATHEEQMYLYMYICVYV